jgi:hypothetical protein
MNDDDLQRGRLNLQTECLLTSLMRSLYLKPKADHNPISHDLYELNSCLKVPSGTSRSAASTTVATCAIRNAILERKNRNTTFESFPYSLRYFMPLALAFHKSYCFISFL